MIRYENDLVCVVDRNSPLSDIHPDAELAAVAAETAGAKQRFWKTHRELPRHQEALAPGGLVRHAAASGLDMCAFGRDLLARRRAGHVEEDRRGGERSGVTATPTIIIDGERFAPKFDLQALAEVLAGRLNPE